MALAAAGVLSLVQPAQAVSGSKTGTVLTAGEWTGLSGVASAASGVTGNAFWAACMADRAALANNQAPQALSRFMTSPLNGVDGIVVDLGSNVLKAGAAINVKIAGPGSIALATVPLTKVPGGVFTQDQPIPLYDFDLSFFSTPAKASKGSNIPGSGCTDQNPGGSATNPCYSHSSDADESTTCIKGGTDGYGARYILATLSLNIPINKDKGPRPGPVPYTLTWTY